VSAPERAEELAAARAAVGAGVAILREGRGDARGLTRIGKAAKDFLTEVDLASEAAIRAELERRTPGIGFFGEEGGGPALDAGRVWVADPLDGTVNYATGSPLCGVMLALVEEGESVLGVIDLPFLGLRAEARLGHGATLGGEPTRVDEPGGLPEAIVGMGDAFHKGGPRLRAYLELTMAVHERALRFRCVGAASVLWTWLAGGQIHGVVLAHNNPYDVAAGHVIAREAGAVVSDYAGAPLEMGSPGALAAVPGAHSELLELARPLAAAAAG
jgi:myo-inositol-1(or 4)-monophosphatase